MANDEYALALEMLTEAAGYLIEPRKHGMDLVRAVPRTVCAEAALALAAGLLITTPMAPDRRLKMARVARAVYVAVASRLPLEQLDALDHETAQELCHRKERA